MASLFTLYWVEQLGDAAIKEAQHRQDLENRQIAKKIMDARRNNSEAFPSTEIETLTEIAYKVVAENFSMYPELEGIKDEKVLNEIVKLTDINLPITTTARNIDMEFYWKEKCDKQLKNCKKEQHGNSYKQAYIERKI